MARLPYATEPRFPELMRHSGLPENTPLTNALCMVAHTPSIGAPLLRLVFELVTGTNLDPEMRELVVLRVAQRCGGRYAWVQHAGAAGQAGVSGAQIAALASGETPAALFSDRERTVFDLADEVLDDCRASDNTFAAVRRLFSPREVVELLLLIGYVRMICGLKDEDGRV
jgi:alkylhydroperoxidase family enzyme